MQKHKGVATFFYMFLCNGSKSSLWIQFFKVFVLSALTELYRTSIIPQEPLFLTYISKSQLLFQVCGCTFFSADTNRRHFIQKITECSNNHFLYNFFTLFPALPAFPLVSGSCDGCSERYLSSMVCVEKSLTNK